MGTGAMGSYQKTDYFAPNTMNDGYGGNMPATKNELSRYLW
jgi:hypothetical protein